jgi:UDP-glucose 4-epimerase
MITKLVLKKELLGKQTVFNISGGESLTISKVIQLVEEVFQTQIQYVQKPSDASIIKTSNVSNEKALNFLDVSRQDQFTLLREYLEELTSTQ